MGTEEQGGERRGVGLMLVSIVFYAVNVLVLRWLSLRAPEVDGWVATLYRGFVGLALMCVIYRGRGFSPTSLIGRPLVLARGAVGAAGIILFYLTIPELGAGRAVILNLTYPLFGAVMAASWLGERLRRGQLGWMLVALGGLLVFFADSLRGRGFSAYEVVGIAGAVTAGLAVVLIRMLRHTEHPSTVYGSQCAWSILVGLPMGGAVLPGLSPGLHAGLLLAAVSVAVAQITMTQAFHLLSVAKGSSIQMLLPLLTALGGWMWFGETLRWTEWMGGAITLVAIWLSVRPGRG